MWSQGCKRGYRAVGEVSRNSEESSVENICNMDESGVFWIALPESGILQTGKKG